MSNNLDAQPPAVIKDEFNLDNFLEDIPDIEEVEKPTTDIIPYQTDDAGEPKVGMEELNSLADIFEGQTPDLDQTWQEEEIIAPDNQQLSSQSDNSITTDEPQDLSDLIKELDELDIPEAAESTEEDLLSLFDEEFPEEAAFELLQSRESTRKDSQPNLTPSLTDKDLEELLSFGSSEGSLTQKTNPADELSSLFDDTFFEENSSSSESTPPTKLDSYGMGKQQPIPPSTPHPDPTHTDLNEDLNLVNDLELIPNHPPANHEQPAINSPSTTGSPKPTSTSARPSEASTPTRSPTVKGKNRKSHPIKSNKLPDSSPKPLPTTQDQWQQLEQLLAEATAHYQNVDFDSIKPLDVTLPTAEVVSEQKRIFDELELLLNETSSPEPNHSLDQETPKTNQADSVEDDFKDLEDLLQQANQSISAIPGGMNQELSRQTRRPRSKLFEQTMRVPVKQLDTLSNLVGELVVGRNTLEQDQERLRQFLDNLSHQVSSLNDVGLKMRDLYERTLLENSLLSSSKIYRTTSIQEREQGNQNSSTLEEYHPLEMDRFTGFHLLSQEIIELIVRVKESASDIEFLVDETDQVTRTLRQVTNQLQEGLTRSRMVPFAQAADRMPRAVREISLQEGKEAELHVEGRETLIDKMILEHLYDPMTHLVNNAITHGIELPEERLAAGKPRAGKITLGAFYQGNQTVISISDNGGGIDPDRIRAKALEKNLISPTEAKTLSDLELFNFIFHPGFTTAEKVTDTKGRGVGMDVVRTCLSEIRGTITIDSTLGEGTTFTIRLPLTLSICKALCCVSDRARIAFPMDGVEDMQDVSPDCIQTNSQGQAFLQWRDSQIPFKPLSELLTYHSQLSRASVYGSQREDNLISVVVLRSTGNMLAVEVDQVLGEQEIVIKQIEGPAPKPVGITGATVLGDGRVMPIADVLELIDLAMGRIRKDGGVAIWQRMETPTASGAEVNLIKSDPMVLIVDDSITVRELLSMTFSKAGYRVEQARDGQEAWDKLRSGLPCEIVFCDIEMPRMDGLELLSRLQKDPDLCEIPLAMLTSRGADRHRKVAADLGARGYFTKPYLEDVLLDAAQRIRQGEVLLAGSNQQ
ncbi:MULTISPECIES: hybrid sensor histidine kinase/response regulator [unclassified Moorena]|uniref:hybrid sensor histidine kinase/response regulator n=1 Tax=unclassified Moorena TaxID=2683338 RepID=UPI0013BB6819|nr:MULTISPECIES: hybrid sensor histidine kinase/response regulator [unclassified Moorena]NEQ06158.1 response regulator [Moorena sp. SIO4E2]NES42120.1 response regulator [Moorena sp. SIO2C4]